MSSSGLFAEVKKHPWIIALVVVVHMFLIALLSLNLLDDEKPPMPASQKHETINAVAVDAKKYDEREKKKKQAVQKKVDDKRAAEKKKQQELQRKKALEKKKREQAVAAKKQVEKKKVEKEKAEKKKAEQKKKQIALAKKKEAEKKAKQEKAVLEKAKLEKARQVREEKARKLKEEQRIKQEKLAAEKKRKLEEQQRLAEEAAEFQRDLLEEEMREENARKQAARAARLQTQREQYIMLIAQRVENSWLRPVMASNGQSCDVVVTQTMTGDVIDVQVQSCTADDAFQRSVERAVRKASPLPLPPDPELYDRQIYFTFKPH